MLKKFLDWIRQVLKKLVNRSIIKDKLHIDVAVSPEMADKITLWSSMYSNEPPWKSSRVKSLNLPCAIAAEYARLVTIEMKSEIMGSKRADFLNKQYQPVIGNVRTYCEYGCAKGGIALKPFIDGTRIAVDAVHADRFFPTAHNGSEITGAVFVAVLTKGSKYYTKFEHHNLTDKGYEIINKAYVSDNKSVTGNEIDLASVDEWASIAPYTLIENVDKPLFAYFRVPFANTIDPSSPLGVSVYSRADELIREADEQFGSVVWEYRAGEMAVHASKDLFKNNPKTGRPELPKGKERLFRTFDFEAEEGDKAMQVYAPALRDESYFNGLNRFYQRIEFACGLAYGTISDPQNVDKTAEEIKASKQRSYASVKDVQKALQAALEQLIYAMDVWATIGNLAPGGAYSASFDWDDSIVVDKDKEREKKLQEVSAGLLKPEIYLMETRGITEEEARKLLPDMEELTKESQPEDEPGAVNADAAVDRAEQVAGKTLNGAQTQSLMSVIAQYQAGGLTVGQAINIISISLGITKEEAKRILEGAE